MDLNVEEFQDLLDGEHYHFCVSQDLGFRRPVKGFGSDRERELALKKAMSEFAERAAYFRVSDAGRARTSNGFACHPEKVEAIRRASYELFERDLVMSQWLKMKPPKWFDQNDLIRTGISEKLRSFESKGFKLRFGILGEFETVKVLICTLHSMKRNFGFSFASTASESITDGFQSLVSDQRRAATIVLSRESAGESFACALTPSELLTPQDHRDFYFDPANASDCSWFFEQGASEVRAQPEIQIMLLHPTVELPWASTIAQASSNALQNYFVGAPTDSKLNLARLEVVSSKLLNSQPHPLA